MPRLKPGFWPPDPWYNPDNYDDPADLIGTGYQGYSARGSQADTEEPDQDWNWYENPKYVFLVSLTHAISTLVILAVVLWRLW